MSTRDQIREAFFNIKPKVKLVPFGQFEIELRQPSVREVMGQGSSTEDRALNMCKMLMNYCYVPGSSERVFDDADIDSMKEVPVSEEWMALTQAINDLTAVAELAKEGKGDSKTPSS